MDDRAVGARGVGVGAVLQYRPVPGGRWYVVLLGAFFAVAAVALVGSAAVGGASAFPWPFVGAWLAAGAWNAYWFGWRIAAELRLGDDGLEWRSVARRELIPYADVVRVRSSRVATNLEVLDLADGRRRLVLAAKGIAEVNDELVRRHPELPVELGRFFQLRQRFGRTRARWVAGP